MAVSDRVHPLIWRTMRAVVVVSDALGQYLLEMGAPENEEPFRPLQGPHPRLTGSSPEPAAPGDQDIKEVRNALLKTLYGS
jgi:hypothetical protein